MLILQGGRKAFPDAYCYWRLSGRNTAKETCRLMNILFAYYLLSLQQVVSNWTYRKRVMLRFIKPSNSEWKIYTNAYFHYFQYCTVRVEFRRQSMGGRESSPNLSSIPAVSYTFLFLQYSYNFLFLQYCYTFLHFAKSLSFHILFFNFVFYADRCTRN